jgi:hypothetical protein
VNAMHEELNNFTPCRSLHKMQGLLEQNGCSITNKMIKA